MKIIVRIIWTLLFLLLVSALSAQDAGVNGAPDIDPAEPEEPGLILPTMLLEIEDLSVESLEVPLPEEEVLEVAEMEIPLPREDELAVPDDAFAIPLPGIESGYQEAEAEEPSFFSTGIIGVGTMNHILGSVSLYKLGTEPRFRFRFSHEGMDGYAFKDPGTGYFHREDLLEGWLGVSSGAVDLGLEAGFTEREKGLQGLSDFYSVNHRYISASPSFGLKPADFFSMQTQVDFSATNRILAVSTQSVPAVREQEILLNPDLNLSFILTDLSINLGGYYGLQVVDGFSAPIHRAGARAGFELSLFDQVLLTASGGPSWVFRPGLEFIVPFDVGLSINITESLSINANGGNRHVPLYFSEMWKEIPLLAVSQPIAEPSTLYLGGGFQWDIAERVLELTSSVEYAYRQNAILPDLSAGGFDPAGGTYSYSQGNITSFSTSASLKWDPFNFLAFAASWDAIFLERSIDQAAHSIGAELELRSEEEDYGITVSAVEELKGEPLLFQLPLIGLSGFADLTEGIRLSIELSDILSPFMTRGRIDYEPFIKPGFRAKITTQISL